jgi:pimeloyl-[acyl-carrier protein] methyl ester esterase
VKPLLVLVHGWGFDASLWDEMRSHFEPDETLAWDLGFFGAPRQDPPPAGRPILAVGHSFGLLWLLHERPVPYRAIVSINGFSCFARRPDFSAGIAQPMLARMRSRIARDPANVVRNFRASCGVTAPLAADPVPERLAAGLEALQNWDARQSPVTIALCGAGDSLVSPAMSSACFGAKIHWHEGGHMLPLTAAAWCARRLRELSQSLA